MKYFNDNLLHTKIFASFMHTDTIQYNIITHNIGNVKYNLFSIIFLLIRVFVNCLLIKFVVHSRVELLTLAKWMFAVNINEPITLDIFYSSLFQYLSLCLRPEQDSNLHDY